MPGILDSPAAMATAGLGATLMMIRIATIKNVLELRRARHTCRSCGRSFNGRMCPVCWEGGV